MFHLFYLTNLFLWCLFSFCSVWNYFETSQFYDRSCFCQRRRVKGTRMCFEGIVCPLALRLLGFDFCRDDIHRFVRFFCLICVCCCVFNDNWLWTNAVFLFFSSSFFFSSLSRALAPVESIVCCGFGCWWTLESVSKARWFVFCFLFLVFVDIELFLGSSMLRFEIAHGKAYGALSKNCGCNAKTDFLQFFFLAPACGKGSRWLNEQAKTRPHFLEGLSNISGGKVKWIARKKKKKKVIFLKQLGGFRSRRCFGEERWQNYWCLGSDWRYL